MTITLASTKNGAFIAAANVLLLLWQLKIFHWLSNEKNENWHLLLSYCRYFDKIFKEVVV